jgi:hypothetical protein
MHIIVRLGLPTQTVTACLVSTNIGETMQVKAPYDALSERKKKKKRFGSVYLFLIALYWYTQLLAPSI